MDERTRHRQFEEQFHRQLRARAQALLHRTLPADQFQLETVADGIDGVRATLMRLGKHDRSLLDELPGTRAVQMRFQRRLLGPFYRTVARLRAQVLAPVEMLVKGQTPGPVGREDVLDALARYELMPQRDRPTAVVYASPTGFTAEARALVQRGEGPTLVLLGGRPDGGWDVDLPDNLRRQSWAKLFELESQDERLKRLLSHLEKNANLLDSRGVGLPELAAWVGVSEEEARALVQQACRQDSRLLTVVHDGTMHLCRSPLADEGQSMNLRSWVRKLLRLKPTVAEQVRMLTTQRVQLEQQRHEVDQRVTALEAEERGAVEQGAVAKTDVERKQLAGRLVRVRRDLRRVRAQANIFTQQIDILGTHIHHLTLAEQGKRVSLPRAEELTQQAAEAEQMIKELAVNADLAAGIEVGAQTPLMAEEEAAIFEEFKQAAAQQVAAASSAGKTPAAPARAETTPPMPSAQKDKARPEMG